MGKWLFRKQGPKHIRELCVRCNTFLQKRVAGKEVYRALCTNCDTEIYEKKKNKPIRDWLILEPTQKEQEVSIKRDKSYKKHKKLFCESCNFIPVDSCQLDVDHIDGDCTNNELDNLQTLCANCHRLKTKEQKDWQNKRPQGT